MLTHGGDCTGAIPPAVVTQDGAGLFPSAGTCREGLGCGDPQLQLPKDKDVLPWSYQAALGAFIPITVCQSRMLWVEKPPCPACNWIPAL